MSLGTYPEVSLREARALLAKGINPKINRKQKFRFERDVLLALGSMSVYNVRRTDLLEVIAGIERRKAFTTAEKLRT